MKTLKILVAFFSVLLVKCQIPISLETAYQKSLENNLGLKGSQLVVNYQNTIKNSSAMIDPLNITGEIGQMNSVYVDNSVTISQKLRFPQFYKSQKQILQEEWKNSVLKLDVQKWQLQREIALIYNTLNYLDEKQKLLEKVDSIYSEYYKKADLRLKNGESNILEKTTAENYRSQASIQLHNLSEDRSAVLHQFNVLINGTEMYINEKGRFYEVPLIFDEEFEGNTVYLKQMEQQKFIETAKLAAEKTKLLPGFNVGLTSATQYGVGADDNFYNRSKRFQSALIGIELPLFSNAQKSVIEGQKINIQIAENHYKITEKALKNQYTQAYSHYQRLKLETEYYQTKGLKNAETIMFTANLLSKEGEINYLEYTLLVNQSLEIRNKYLEAQKALNDKIIELKALKGESY
ncbi:MAG: TolC family protein [Kaistella sp.]|nr:TolC family protein [Kaistella sp.]